MRIKKYGTKIMGGKAEGIYTLVGLPDDRDGKCERRAKSVI